MKKIFFLILLFSLVILPIAVFAQSQTIDTVGQKLTDLAKQIGAYIVIIGWVIAGILYLISSGDPGKMKTAHQALIACLIGTVAIALAAGADLVQTIKNALGL